MSAPQNPAIIYRYMNEQWLFWEKREPRSKKEAIGKNQEARKNQLGRNEEMVLSPVSKIS